MARVHHRAHEVLDCDVFLDLRVIDELERLLRVVLALDLLRPVVLAAQAPVDALAQGGLECAHDVRAIGLHSRTRFEEQRALRQHARVVRRIEQPIAEAVHHRRERYEESMRGQVAAVDENPEILRVGHGTPILVVAQLDDTQCSLPPLACNRSGH